MGGCGYCEGLRHGPIVRRMAGHTGAPSVMCMTEFVIQAVGVIAVAQAAGGVAATWLGTTDQGRGTHSSLR